MIKHVGDWLTVAPWRNSAVSLLLLDGPVITQAHTVADKPIDPTRRTATISANILDTPSRNGNTSRRG